MKNDIKKRCTFLLILSIILSVFFVVGIVSIIYGATNSTALLILGIIMTVLGFYGSPISWVNFGTMVVEKALFFAITEDNITEISTLSSNLGINDKDVRAKINHLMSHRYLTGYKLDENGNLLKLEKKQEETHKMLKLKKCPNCGANLTETKDHKYKCTYCGVTFEK